MRQFYRSEDQAAAKRRGKRSRRGRGPVNPEARGEAAAAKRREANMERFGEVKKLLPLFRGNKRFSREGKSGPSVRPVPQPISLLKENLRKESEKHKCTIFGKEA